jgi:uncharacterized protein YabE (DUF348 family)
VRSKLAVVAVHGVVTAGLVAGTTAFVVLDKNVSISVDGKVSHLRTYASSVDKVLRRAKVTVGAHDVVTPAVSTSVHDGATITIQRGRLVNLTVDGVTRSMWVTAKDVDQALAQAGLRVPGAVVSADRATRVPLSGMSIDIALPHRMTVQVDGRQHLLVTTKATLASALYEAGIVVKAADQVSMPLQTRMFSGLNVVIVRHTSGQQLETLAVPFTTATKTDANALVGTKTVAQQGKNGTLVRTWQLSFADGKQTGKTLAGQQITVAPVQQIIAIGTKPKPKPKPRPLVVYATSADGLNWAALARCESGGRANATNPPFYGLYQFRLGTWQAVGGTGLPSQASASEQTYRAQLLYKRSNWRAQWPVCGRYLFP